MKPKKPALYLMSLAAILLFTTGVYGQSDDGKSLIALQKRRIEAMVHQDTLALRSLLADSLTYIHSSGVVDNKASFLKDVGSGRISYLFILPEKLTAKIDGNFGYIYGRANVRFKLASMTGTIDQYISFVEVYILKRYQWQMVICQNARIEPGAPYTNLVVPQVKGGSVPSIY